MGTWCGTKMGWGVRSQGGADSFLVVVGDRRAEEEEKKKRFVGGRQVVGLQGGELPGECKSWTPNDMSQGL